MEEINKVNKIIENNNEEKIKILTKEELMVIVKKYSINYHSMNRRILEEEFHIKTLESNIQTLKNKSDEDIKAICIDRDSKTFKERFSSITIVLLLCISLYNPKKKC